MGHKKAKIEELPRFSSKFYPNKLDRKKIVSKYLNDEYKPANVLRRKIEESKKRRSRVKAGKYVAHMFLRDFRVDDNHGLYKASEQAQKLGIPLITIYVHCPEELRSHSVSDFQRKYRAGALKALQKSLRGLNIPLYVLPVEKKRNISKSVEDFVREKHVSHVFGNIEYEVDELRLYEDILTRLSEADVNFTPLHNSCVVTPGILTSKAKKTQYSVFTPWYKAWCKHIEDEGGVQTYPKPTPNSKSFVEDEPWLFDSEVPNEDLNLTKVQEKHFATWPTGEEEVQKAFLKYLKSGDIDSYGDTRNMINDSTVSQMGAHIASGVISTRTMIEMLVENKKISSVSKGNQGCVEYVRQLSWRDFYRHILSNWPHICMFKPFNLDYEDLRWEYNSDHFYKWCQGKTGYPIVDASMRKLVETGHIHNRCRMIVASFLSKHLLIDWRYGERFFMENLIDGDFASNNGGWGFSSSVGVDPQPYFRIFNPWTQSKKFDPNGDFIRRWVYELKDIEDSDSIHNPPASGFGEVAKNNEYPEPIVDHKFARERALERYRENR